MGLVSLELTERKMRQEKVHKSSRWPRVFRLKKDQESKAKTDWKI